MPADRPQEPESLGVLEPKLVRHHLFRVINRNISGDASLADVRKVTDAVMVTVQEYADLLQATCQERDTLRATLVAARAEIDRWGHGDMHYGPRGRDKRVVAALAAIDAALAESGPADDGRGLDEPLHAERVGEPVADILRERDTLRGVLAEVIAAYDAAVAPRGNRTQSMMDALGPRNVAARAAARAVLREVPANPGGES